MELKEVMNVMQVSGERIPSGYYKKPEVDAVIAEKDAEIAELQETNGIIANNAVRLNKDIAELKTNERRLRRALWLTRAEWARSSALSYHLIESHPDKDVAATYKRKANKWEKAKDKFLKKAEEYK